MKKVLFLSVILFAGLLFFASCGNNDKLAPLEDRDYPFKVLYNDLPTAGCWLRFRSDIHGVLKEEPWSAFLLSNDGKYLQATYIDTNISVDTSRSYWHQDVSDLVWITSYKKEFSTRMDIKILGYYSDVSHSFNTYTTVTDTDYTTKKEKKSQFHDIIVKDENYKSVFGEATLNPLCKALYKELEK